MIEIDGKIYRNLEEQVKKNKDDIELLQGQSPDTSGLEQRIETVENQITDLTLEVDRKASQDALNNTNTNVTNNTNAIENINNRLDNLDLTYATDQDIQNLQSQINTKANQSDLNSTNSRVDTLESTVTQLSPQVAKSLKTPMSAPTTTELVAVDTSNGQAMISIGEGLTIENDVLKSKAFEFVGNYSATTSMLSIPIDLTTYDYFAFVSINIAGNASMGIFLNEGLTWNRVLSDGTSQVQYAYLMWGVACSSAVYIKYDGTTTLVQKGDSTGACYNYATGYPKNLTLGATDIALQQSFITLFRRKK